MTATPISLPIANRTHAADAQSSADLQTMRAVLQYALRDIMRNRWMLAYLLGILATTEILVRLTGSGVRALVGMLNLVLLVIPLVTITFGVIYWHSTREFNELLLAQPVRRRALWCGLYLGLVIPLTVALVAGLMLPMLWHGAIDAGTRPVLGAMLIAGVALTAVFGAIAMLIGTRIDDRLRSIGASLSVWLLMTALYDGAVLLVSTVYSDYPLERVMLGLTLANPVDLARTLIVLQTDSAALMGYTGAVVEHFLGSGIGIAVASAGLGVWIAVPAWLALRAFERRDF